MIKTSNDDGEESGSDRKRKPRAKVWTSRDSCLIVDIYESKHKTITGSFDKISGQEGRKAKKDAWSSLLHRFTASAPDDPRTMEELLTRIKNIKQSVRDLIREAFGTRKNKGLEKT